MQATLNLPRGELEATVNGRVTFYVGPVLVAEAKIWTHFLDEADVAAAELPRSWVTVEPYQAIFVSYSHKDATIVDQLERAYAALGMEYLRDAGVRTLVTNVDDPRVQSWYMRRFGYEPTGDTVPKVEPFGRDDVGQWTTLEVDLTRWDPPASRRLRRVS